ncbi:hypothetical protein UK82_24805 [Frankia sp. ACN1ag]|nr:hypothetical protein UK82_24805 [Frankia sp. ACN1ag]
MVYCAAQGWLVQAREMAARLRPDDVGSVPPLWERQLGAMIPDDVRLRLLDALMVPRERPTELAERTDRERDEVLKRLKAQEQRRKHMIWDLLEPVPHLWTGLAQDSEHAKSVRSVLLEYPEELPDDVLAACLPTVTMDDRRTGSKETPSRLEGDLRMFIAARHARRRPRLRVVAADVLRQIAQDAVDDGWTPRPRHLGPDWSGIADLAVLTDDPVLLSEAAVAAAEPARPASPIARYYPDIPDEALQRSNAVVALAANPATPRAELAALLPTLDEQTLRRVLEHADEDLAQSCRVQLDRLHQEAVAHQPRYVAVPGDDELADNADPVAVLRDHTRYLRGPAAQRDVTAEGLLRSHYTTPELLGLIPARRVLGYAGRAEQIAEMIIEVCGDQLDRWEAFAAAAQAKPPASMTFKAWLAQLTDPS